MKQSAKNIFLSTLMIIIGLLFAAFGFYVGETDDAPGAAGLGIIFMSGFIFLGIRFARRKN